MPARPYSPWRRAGDLVIVSGQLGMVEGTLVEGGAPAQLRQALKNGASLLEEAGSSLADVVKATMFMMEMSEFTSLNEVWLDVFSDPLPTRSAFAVAELPLGALVEVEFWAYSPER